MSYVLVVLACLQMHGCHPVYRASAPSLAACRARAETVMRGSLIPEQGAAVAAFCVPVPRADDGKGA